MKLSFSQVSRAISRYKQGRELRKDIKEVEMKRKTSKGYGSRIGSQYMQLYDAAQTNQERERIIQDLKRQIDGSAKRGLIYLDVEEGVRETFPWYVLSREKGIHNL